MANKPVFTGNIKVDDFQVEVNAYKVVTRSADKITRIEVHKNDYGTVSAKGNVKTKKSAKTGIGKTGRDTYCKKCNEYIDLDEILHMVKIEDGRYVPLTDLDNEKIKAKIDVDTINVDGFVKRNDVDYHRVKSVYNLKYTESKLKKDAEENEAKRTDYYSLVKAMGKKVAVGTAFLDNTQSQVVIFVEDDVLYMLSLYEQMKSPDHFGFDSAKANSQKTSQLKEIISGMEIDFQEYSAKFENKYYSLQMELIESRKKVAVSVTEKMDEK